MKALLSIIEHRTNEAGGARRPTAIEARAHQVIHKQGETANAVFYLRSGAVKVTATSNHGKEAIVGLLTSGNFFGEGCLAGQSIRTGTATALTDCKLDRIEKHLMLRMLRDHAEVRRMFLRHLLSRSIRHEEDLLDQLLHNSEKRLARILLLLSHSDIDGKSEGLLSKVNQAHLAQMVGTTRSRVSHFMNRFRKQGYIDYCANGELTVGHSLITVVMRALSNTGATKSASRRGRHRRMPKSTLTFVR